MDRISDEQWLLLSRLAEASVERWRGLIPPQLDIDDLKADVVMRIPHFMTTKPVEMTDEGYISSRATFEVRRVLHNFRRSPNRNMQDVPVDYEHGGFHRIDLADELDVALVDFPPLWRKILLLYYSGLTYSQIGDRFRLSTNWVSDQINEMLSQLGIETPKEAWHRQQMRNAA